MFRFSRKRLFPAVSFGEFKRIAAGVAEMVSPGRNLEVKVMTFEEEVRGRNKDFIFVEKCLDDLRHSYDLSQFTKEVWDVSAGVQLSIKGRTAADSALWICVGWSKNQSASIYFYGQATGIDLANRICNRYARGDLLTFIGTGDDSDGPPIGKEWHELSVG